MSNWAVFTIGPGAALGSTLAIRRTTSVSSGSRVPSEQTTSPPVARAQRVSESSGMKVSSGGRVSTTWAPSADEDTTLVTVIVYPACPPAISAGSSVALVIPTEDSPTTVVKDDVLLAELMSGSTVTPVAVFVTLRSVGDTVPEIRIGVELLNGGSYTNGRLQVTV